MDSSEKNSDRIAQDELQEKQSEDGGAQIASQNLGGNSVSLIQKKYEQEPISGIHMSKSDEEASNSSVTPRDVLVTPGSAAHAFQSGHEGRSPVMREKVTQDGYNWRKYGQKNVKGNEFIRSYYRCTHPGCQVKKQLEYSPDGKVTDIVHLGEHGHPKPQHNVPVGVGFGLSIVDRKAVDPSFTGIEGKTPDAEYRVPSQNKSTNGSRFPAVMSTEEVKNALVESNEADNNEEPLLKRQKKGHYCTDKDNGESRLVIQTESAVDSVSDGYRWRKYGQKMVKGKANPRSYYRCSSPGCTAKKQVERTSHIPKLVTATYEGQHNHEKPASRTIASKVNTPNRFSNHGPSSKYMENVVTMHDKVDKDLDSNRKSDEQLNCESKSQNDGNNVPRPSAIVHCSSVEECKSTGEQSGKTSSTEESDPAGGDHIDQSRSESKANNSGCSVPAMNQDTNNKAEELYTAKSEAERS